MNGIAEAFIAACRDEIEAPKPGNVHVFADGHGMSVRDFLMSAEAAAPGLSTPSSPVGARILAAVEATFAAVGMNTNLGIILLCAPLAAAAETGADLHKALRTTSRRTDPRRCGRHIPSHSARLAGGIGHGAPPRCPWERRCHAFGGDAGSRRPGPDRLSICL